MTCNQLKKPKIKKHKENKKENNEETYSAVSCAPMTL